MEEASSCWSGNHSSKLFVNIAATDEKRLLKSCLADAPASTTSETWTNPSAAPHPHSYHKKNTLIQLEHIQERKWLQIGCKHVRDKWKYNGTLLCRGRRLLSSFFSH